MLLRNDICGYACGFKPPKYVVLSIRKLNWCAVCKYVAYCIESSLYTWVFNFFQMNEGRKSQIVLPDERRLDLLIQVSNHLLGEKIKTMNHRIRPAHRHLLHGSNGRDCVKSQKYCFNMCQSVWNFGRVGSSFWSRTISVAWYAL